MENFESANSIGANLRKYNYSDIEKSIKGIYEKVKGVFIRIISIKKQNSRMTLHGVLMMHGSLEIKEVKAIVTDGRLESIEEVNSDEYKGKLGSELRRGTNLLEKVYK